MEQNTYNFLSLLVQGTGGIAAIIFAKWQIKINDRLKKLQDYVAITLVPSPEIGPKVNIMNVGKINVYLQKYEIGTNIEAFAKPLLIPAGSNSFLSLIINVFAPQQKMQVTIYLFDELGEKFISTGEVIIDNVQIIQQQAINTFQQTSQGQIQTPQVINVPRVVSAQSYQTIKKDWTL